MCNELRDVMELESKDGMDGCLMAELVIKGAFTIYSVDVSENEDWTGQKPRGMKGNNVCGKCVMVMMPK